MLDSNDQLKVDVKKKRGGNTAGRSSAWPLSALISRCGKDCLKKVKSFPFDRCILRGTYMGWLLLMIYNYKEAILRACVRSALSILP